MSLRPCGFDSYVSSRLNPVFLCSRTAPRLPRNASRLSLLPLYAGLPPDEQLKVFEPAQRGIRKVVLSTNIAEVSF